MRRFCIKKVFQAKHMAEIDYDYVSKIKYKWSYENQLHIMKDQRTIIGVEHDEDKNHSVLVIEDMLNQDKNYSPIKITEHNDEITTILVDQDEKNILIGDNNKKVIQYSLNANKDCIKVLKDYGDLNIDSVMSSVIIGNIAIFGGFQNLRKIMID